MVNTSTTFSSYNSARSILTGKAARQSSKWPKPADSVGQRMCLYGKDICWEVKGPAKEAFRSISPLIKDHLEKSAEIVSSWVTWSVYMLGKTPETAVPTILFCGDVRADREELRNVIKESRILDRYSGFKTGHARHPPAFGKAVQATNSGGVSRPYWGIFGTVQYVKQSCGIQALSSPNSCDKLEQRKNTVCAVMQDRVQFHHIMAGHVFGFPGHLRGELTDTGSESDTEIIIDSDYSDDSNADFYDAVRFMDKDFDSWNTAQLIPNRSANVSIGNRKSKTSSVSGFQDYDLAFTANRATDVHLLVGQSSYIPRWCSEETLVHNLQQNIPDGRRRYIM